MPSLWNRQYVKRKKTSTIKAVFDISLILVFALIEMTFVVVTLFVLFLTFIYIFI